MLLLPAAAILWVGLLGFALGAALPLALTLPVDLGHDARDTGAKAGLMLLVGYLLAATGPATIGLIREATLTSTPVFVLLAACAGAFVVLSSRVPVVGRRTKSPALASGG
jgi:MFS transporter, CP family, cyanate transporter